MDTAWLHRLTCKRCAVMWTVGIDAEPAERLCWVCGLADEVEAMTWSGQPVTYYRDDDAEAEDRELPQQSTTRG